MKKILIIEDDLIVANIYRNKLAVEGFTVECAGDGESGLETLSSFQPDAVILDLILPKLSGLEVMKMIRSRPQYQKLPLIVFSNTYLSNLVQEAWKAGATKCLSKANCSPKQVIDSVRGALGMSVEVAAKPQVFEPRAKLVANDGAASNSSQVRNNIANGFGETVTSMRNAIKAMAKSGAEADRLSLLNELYQRTHALTGPAAIAGMADLAQLTEALEAFLTELKDKPGTINASTLRTLAAAIDFLPMVLENPFPASTPTNSKILVVDDEPLSRRAVTHALDRAKLKSVDVDDPQIALKMLAQSTYDLVFLDVDMPGMSGHELCTKLRGLPQHKKTPVVFVTGLSDFQNRANSMISGGNDFIAKPFPFLELAVKSLVYVLRSKYPSGMVKTA